jgi:hypothetical protein
MTTAEPPLESVGSASATPDAPTVDTARPPGAPPPTSESSDEQAFETRQPTLAEVVDAPLSADALISALIVTDAEPDVAATPAHPPEPDTPSVLTPDTASWPLASDIDGSRDPEDSQPRTDATVPSQPTASPRPRATRPVFDGGVPPGHDHGVSKAASVPLAAPERLAVVRVRPHSIKLSWSAPAAASSFVVYRVSLWHPSDRRRSKTTPETEHKFKDLTPGLAYDVALLAVDGDRISPPTTLVINTPEETEADAQIRELQALVMRQIESDRILEQDLHRSIASRDKSNVRAAVLAILEAVIGWPQISKISHDMLNKLILFIMKRRTRK